MTAHPSDCIYCGISNEACLELVAKQRRCCHECAHLDEERPWDQPAWHQDHMGEWHQS